MMVLDVDNPNVTISKEGKAVLRVDVDVFPMPEETVTCNELRQMSEESSKGLLGVPCPSCPSPAFRNTQCAAWKKSASKQAHDVDFNKKVRCEASPNLFHETSDCTPKNRRVAAVRKGACLKPAGSSAVSPSRARAQAPMIKCLMSRHYKRWQTFFHGRVPFFCACCPGCIDSLTRQIYEITGMDIREETEGDTEEELEDSLSEFLATMLRCKHLCSRRETPDTTEHRSSCRAAPRRAAPRRAAHLPERLRPSSIEETRPEPSSRVRAVVVGRPRAARGEAPSHKF